MKTYKWAKSAKNDQKSAKITLFCPKTPQKRAEIENVVFGADFEEENAEIGISQIVISKRSTRIEVGYLLEVVLNQDYIDYAFSQKICSNTCIHCF